MGLSAQASNVQYTITYKKGHVGGHIGTDTLSITDTPILLANQTIGLTTETTLDFGNATCDGIFVSAWPTCACDREESARVAGFWPATAQDSNAVASECAGRYSCWEQPLDLVGGALGKRQKRVLLAGGFR